MSKEQLEECKQLLRQACGADWARADTLCQAIERLALRVDHCPSCYALSQVFVLTAEGERCPDPWHQANRPEQAPQGAPCLFVEYHGVLDACEMCGLDRRPVAT